MGNGVTVDFGKWASSIGIEGNYTKDQIHYSRSLWFNYLPFYHMGVRAKYGTDQTEPFNAYTDQMAGLELKLEKAWTGP